jgi:two-component system chemotaxis response regulator CheY
MDAASKKVLVVDDSSTMRRILIQALKRCGFVQIVESGDGVDALAKCKEQTFDVVLTDWNMPQMDGLELIKLLRTIEAYAKVPIVMVTTEGAKTDVVEALTMGVTSYIVKPFTPDTLMAKMSELFDA